MYYTKKHRKIQAQKIKGFVLEDGADLFDPTVLRKTGIVVTCWLCTQDKGEKKPP